MVNHELFERDLKYAITSNAQGDATDALKGSNSYVGADGELTFQVTELVGNETTLIGVDGVSFQVEAMNSNQVEVKLFVQIKGSTQEYEYTVRTIFCNNSLIYFV